MIPAEGELLLCSARTRFDAGVAQRLRELARGPLDWQRVGALAHRHKVTPLLHHALSELRPEGAPAEFVEGLERQMQKIAAQNQANLETLARNLRLFAEAGIPVFAFKGVAAALADYGGIDLRIGGDVDLLVHRADFLKARDLLTRNGYRNMYFGQHEVATVQASLHDGRICVDLHYGITPHFHIPQMDRIGSGSRFAPHERNSAEPETTRWFFYLECDELWQRLVHVQAGDTRIPLPAPEDAFLIACIQGIKENWRRLTRVCDVAQIIASHPGLDWDRLSKQAVDLGCEQKFLFTAQLAHRLLDAPLPAQIAKRIAARPVLDRLALETRRRCFEEEEGVDTEIFRHASSLLTMDGARDCARYLGYALRRLAAPGEKAVSLRRHLRLLRSIAAL
jgi:hypothetical protein